MNDHQSPDRVIRQCEEGILSETEALQKLQAVLLGDMDVQTVHAPFLLAQLAGRSETASQAVWAWMTEELSRVRFGKVPYMLADLLFHLLDNTLAVHRSSLPDVFERYRRGEPPVLQTVLLYSLARMIQRQDRGWKVARQLYASVIQHPLIENEAISDLVRRYIGRRTLKQERADLESAITAWMEGLIQPGSDQMTLLRHFIIFERTPQHCVTWLVQARSLYDACRKWALDQYAKPGQGSTLILDLDDYGEVVYDHPLACIEAFWKVPRGDLKGWYGWEIRELRQGAWEAEIAEVFCSEDPYSIQDYITQCLPLFRQAYPRQKARAFVWYLEAGPLVTFYRFRGTGSFAPVEILCRFLLPDRGYSEVRAWHGTYEDILEQMRIDFPF